MLSNSLVYSIALLLAAQGTVGQMTIDGSCRITNRLKVQQALTEVANMATFANQRTQGLRADNLPEPDRKTTFNTFFAYFGISQGKDSLKTADQLITIYQRMININTQPPTVTIYCDDAQLLKQTTVDRNGQPIENGFQYYVDTQGAQGPGQYYFPRSFAPCSALSGEDDDAAYTDTNIQAIVICPAQINGQDATLGSRTTNYRGRFETIDDLCGALSVVLFHEFMHLLFDPQMLFGTGEVYGYDGCVAHKANFNTVQQPDCVAFYTASLYLNANDWSTGVAKAYGVNPPPAPPAPSEIA